jgi:LssY C-terminus
MSSDANVRLRVRRGLAGAILILATYLFVAYVILPLLWREHEGPGHPALDSLPRVTHNADGIPSDPLNVGLIGSDGQLVRAMHAAGWRPADPITFKSSVKIAASVMFDRPDPDAPVSNLYVFGRKQDLAFEREVGSSADRRHHVRWWRSNEVDSNGRPFWIGDATFDIGSGLSHLTGQITHHIAPDVDAERALLIADLANAGQLQRHYQVMGVGPTQDGRNSGGDRYYTDGMLSVGVLVATKAPADTPAPGSGR